MIQWILDCWSRKQKRKNQPITSLGIEHWTYLRFFQLLQSSFHQVGKRQSHTSIISVCFWFCQFDFHQIVSFHAADYDSDYDSVASENQPLGVPPRNISRSHTGFWLERFWLNWFNKGAATFQTYTFLQCRMGYRAKLIIRKISRPWNRFYILF